MTAAAAVALAGQAALLHLIFTACYNAARETVSLAGYAILLILMMSKELNVLFFE
jgi:hypothetical protein